MIYIVKWYDKKCRNLGSVVADHLTDDILKDHFNILKQVGIGPATFPFIIKLEDLDIIKECPGISIDSDKFYYEIDIDENTDLEDKSEWIEDGFGSRISKTCSKCNDKSVYFVRIGKTQCYNCD